jgi:hypothetical protein
MSDERFEALACHIYQGIKGGIAEHNKHERSLGLLPAVPEEISMSIAEAVTMVLGNDGSIERLIENLRLAATSEIYDLL